MKPDAIRKLLSHIEDLTESNNENMLRIAQSDPAFALAICIQDANIETFASMFPAEESPEVKHMIVNAVKRRFKEITGRDYLSERIKNRYSDC